jgi:hypothetical protein
MNHVSLLLALPLASGLLAGCARTYWVAHESAQLEFEDAAQRCEQALTTSRDPKHRVAARTGRSQVLVGGPNDDFAVQREFRKCMRKFGFESVVLTEAQYEALRRRAAQPPAAGAAPAGDSAPAADAPEPAPAEATGPK